MSESAAHEETYRGYLARISAVDLSATCERLGAEAEADGLVVPLFGESHRVGTAGVFGPDGRRPHLSVCVILCRHVLLCPPSAPSGGDWASFKDFRDAAPLVGSFAGTVEGAIARAFAGRANALLQAAAGIGGQAPIGSFSHDVAIAIPALPKVPLLLLFNDADDEFPAACSVLFERRAAGYLDMECLAMLGMQLARRLEVHGGQRDPKQHP
jgi:hypothetical protein